MVVTTWSGPALATFISNENRDIRIHFPLAKLLGFRRPQDRTGSNSWPETNETTLESFTSLFVFRFGMIWAWTKSGFEHQLFERNATNPLAI